MNKSHAAYLLPVEARLQLDYEYLLSHEKVPSFERESFLKFRSLLLYEVKISEESLSNSKEEYEFSLPYDVKRLDSVIENIIEVYENNRKKEKDKLDNDMILRTFFIAIHYRYGCGIKDPYPRFDAYTFNMIKKLIGGSAYDNRLTSLPFKIDQFKFNMPTLRFDFDKNSSLYEFKIHPYLKKWLHNVFKHDASLNDAFKQLNSTYMTKASFSGFRQSSDIMAEEWFEKIFDSYSILSPVRYLGETSRDEKKVFFYREIQFIVEFHVKKLMEVNKKISSNDKKLASKVQQLLKAFILFQYAIFQGDEKELITEPYNKKEVDSLFTKLLLKGSEVNGNWLYRNPLELELFSQLKLYNPTY